MTKTNASSIRILLTLSGLTFLGPFALDAFLPAIKGAAQDLNTTEGQIMISWAMLAVGSGLGQIFYGPISDKVGRKPVIIFGLTLYIITSAISATVTSVEPLFFLRFFQGLAVASSMIMMRSVVRDLFNVKEGAKLFSNLFCILAFMPIIGPVIGGYLTNEFGWHSLFIGMALASSISLIIIIVFLDESLSKKDKNALRPKILMDSFKEIISEYNFLTFLLIGIGTYIGLFGVLAGITTVLTGSLQQNAEMVGYYISTVMVGHFVFAVLAGAIIQYLGINRIIFIGTLTSLFGATILGWWALNGIITIYSVLIPTTIYLMGFALTLPAMSAGAMSNFQHMSGRASSLLGFIHQVAGALTAIIIGFVVDGTQIPMAIALFSGSLFAFLIYIIRISKVRFED